MIRSEFFMGLAPIRKQFEINGKQPCDQWNAYSALTVRKVSSEVSRHCARLISRRHFKYLLLMLSTAKTFHRNADDIFGTTQTSVVQRRIYTEISQVWRREILKGTKHLAPKARDSNGKIADPPASGT